MQTSKNRVQPEWRKRLKSEFQRLKTEKTEELERTTRLAFDKNR